MINLTFSKSDLIALNLKNLLFKLIITILEYKDKLFYRKVLKTKLKESSLKQSYNNTLFLN